MPKRRETCSFVPGARDVSCFEPLLLLLPYYCQPAATANSTRRNGLAACRNDMVTWRPKRQYKPSFGPFFFAILGVIVMVVDVPNIY
jgi:hypothetical protein